MVGVRIPKSYKATGKENLLFRWRLFQDVRPVAGTGIIKPERETFKRTARRGATLGCSDRIYWCPEKKIDTAPFKAVQKKIDSSKLLKSICCWRPKMPAAKNSFMKNLLKKNILGRFKANGGRRRCYNWMLQWNWAPYYKWKKAQKLELYQSAQPGKGTCKRNAAY